MKTIKGIWRFSRVICYTFVCLFQAYTRFKRVDRKEKGRMLRYYPTQVLKLAGVRCSYEGNVPELLHECGLTDTPPAYMVLSNHISWLDIFSLDSQLPSRFIAKAEIAKWPVFGLIAQQIGVISFGLPSLWRGTPTTTAAGCQSESTCVISAHF